MGQIKPNGGLLNNQNWLGAGKICFRVEQASGLWLSASRRQLAWQRETLPGHQKIHAFRRAKRFSGTLNRYRRDAGSTIRHLKFVILNYFPFVLM